MKLAVSFSTTRFSDLRLSWKSSSSKTTAHSSAEFETVSGGIFLVIDWDTGVCEKIIQVNQATGFCKIGKDYLVASGNKLILLDCDFCVKKKIHHRLFNNIHSIIYKNENIGVTSSGTDSIVVLDKNYNEQYTWCAVYNGYDKNQFGKTREIDLGLDHSLIFYPTKLHTTHINSIWLDIAKNSFYSTLFWQGEVIEVSIKTGSTRVLGKNFRFPHSLKRTSDDRWMFSDTGNNRIVFTKDWRNYHYTCLEDVSWLQDTTQISSDRFIVSDANNNRLLEIDVDGHVIKEWKFSPQWKVYQTCLI
ncbi:hypothetical protein [Alteromonas stellipolaris]|uniref:hypothetical protein n=1 Tax=Alteromonas stellipolaris TaxID=233316 RepID=UPI0026E30C4C|nr:hypothetical protein [Alteromonas stellipolaris]MDO6532996.1 hypothetical protein [Alteromonas stellipolaris]MDO6624799.1 hypothetical protein [Alteromonas stellipolaris]